MDTYLVAVSDKGEPFIVNCHGKSLSNALDNLLKELREIYPWMESETWDDALTELDEKDIVVGEVYNMIELEC